MNNFIFLAELHSSQNVSEDIKYTYRFRSIFSNVGWQHPTKSNNDQKHSKLKSKTRKVTKKEPYINVIVDSGATRHYCNNLDIMSNVRNTNVNIMVGNGNIIRATKMGDIGCIKDVLYLPEIKHFLFSISYMLYTNSDIRVEFFKDGFQLKNKRKTIARGILGGNLYVMRVRLPKKYRHLENSLTDKSLFVDLKKSNMSASQLNELKGDLPIRFERI